jgi:hypothetical protein
MIKKVTSKIVAAKNSSLTLYFIWSLYIFLLGKLSRLFISDKQSIFKRYYKLSHMYPNLQKPTLFSEKMQWIKLNYQNSEMELCADKELVREYILNKGFGELLNDKYQTIYSVNNLDLDSLPNKFTLKATHGSGWNLIVRDKNSVNWFVWKLMFRLWLSSDIYWAGREWVYKNLKPALIIEKYLEDSIGELKDYKFHCFHGEVKYIQVNQGRDSASPIQNFYDLDWTLQNFGKDIAHNENANISPPTQLNYMLEIAKDLSSPFPYARVDFYQVDERVIFGEITFFPAGGYPDFNPSEYDKIWGDMLVLPEKDHGRKK